jgi:proteasome lid subunit RPN8/RPN11
MPPHRFKLSRQHFDEIAAHLRDVLPLEGCGLLAGIAGNTHSVIPIENVLHSSTRFRMDPEQQVAAMHSIRQAGLRVLGIYHSHPQGPGQPSPTDLLEAAYPEAVQLIFWLQGDAWKARAFSIVDGKAAEVKLAIR